MNREQREALAAKYAGRISAPYAVVGVRTLFDPHPFMVGPRHVAEAADHHGGMLGQAVLDKIPCAQRGCSRPHREHTSSAGLFISVPAKLEVLPEDLRLQLLAITEEGEADGITGFGFIEPGRSLWPED